MSLVHKDDRRAYQQQRLDGDGVGLANPRQHEGMVHDGAEAAREREGSRRDDLLGGAVCFRERALFEPAATSILSVEPQWPGCEPAHLLLRLQLRC